MAGWTCPDCRRRFLRAGQGHECAPAMSLEDYLATAPPHEPPVVAAVLDHLHDLGPLHVEPVSVGVFLKRAQCFAQLRPMVRWEALSLRCPGRSTAPASPGGRTGPGTSSTCAPAPRSTTRSAAG